METRTAYTIGFTKHSAEEFFGLIKAAGVKRLLDVRLRNASQLAGFAKQKDLKYFMDVICGAQYVHEPLLAPTDDLLDARRQKRITWGEYEEGFIELMSIRKMETVLSPSFFDVATVLLCSEHSAERCHRRLVLDYLQASWGCLRVIHL